MDRYDQVVIGSGVSGLTASVLLAQGGRKVLLLEKAPTIGGALTRFYREGVPFDTGFHFTGGFADDGLLHEMSKVLGIRDAIVPIVLSPDAAFRFIFEEDGRVYDFPYGIPRLLERLQEYFPADAAGIRQYFGMLKQVWDRTGAMELAAVLSSAMSTAVINEDHTSLQSVLDDLLDSPYLKTLVSAFCMCYGVKPTEVSFANHSRMCHGLYESVARIEGGGGAFIQAFARRLTELGVDVRCGRHVAECADIRGDAVHRFILNTGEEVELESCVLTIHPKEVLKILPKRLLSPAFVTRISDFESSCGFFTVFGVVEAGCKDDAIEKSIVSLLPSTDVNEMLDPWHEGDSALVVIGSVEDVAGVPVKTRCAFEPSFMTEVAEWTDSRTGRRSPGYLEYKRKRAARMQERMNALLDEQKGCFRLRASASVLTYRDHLHSPDGSAYGVKQKLGQINLLGKLPVRNMYIAGQSAVLPGVLGAMLSSFFVTRAVLGKATFGNILLTGGC